MALSVLGFFAGLEVFEGEGLDFAGELVQLAAQWPTWPQRKHRVALALEAALPRCGGFDCL